MPSNPTFPSYKTLTRYLDSGLGAPILMNVRDGL